MGGEGGGAVTYGLAIIFERRGGRVGELQADQRTGRFLVVAPFLCGDVSCCVSSIDRRTR